MIQINVKSADDTNLSGMKSPVGIFNLYKETIQKVADQMIRFPCLKEEKPISIGRGVYLCCKNHVHIQMHELCSWSVQEVYVHAIAGTEQDWTIDVGPDPNTEVYKRRQASPPKRLGPHRIEE